MLLRVGLLVGGCVLFLASVFWFVSNVYDPVPCDVSEWIERSTVRIRRGNVCGSGTVISSESDRVIVLTNAHVAGDDIGGVCRVELFRDGFKADAVEGEIVACAYDDSSAIDLALLSLDVSQLGGYRPPSIGLGVDVSRGTIRSRGCPGCDWPAEFCGHVLRVRSGTFSFVPDPQPGRSGSGVLEVVDGVPQLVGLLTWSGSGPDADGRYGIAQSVTAIREVLSGGRPKSVRSSTWLPVATSTECDCVTFGQDVTNTWDGFGDVVVPAAGNCGPGGCEGGQCDLFQGGSQGFDGSRVVDRVALPFGWFLAIAWLVFSISSATLLVVRLAKYWQPVTKTKSGRPRKR